MPRIFFTSPPGGPDRESYSGFDGETRDAPFRHAIREAPGLQSLFAQQLNRLEGHEAERPPAIGDDFLAFRQLANALFELLDGDIQRAGHVARGEFPGG